MPTQTGKNNRITFDKLLCLFSFGNDFLTLVITASLAYAVCKNVLAALRALYDIGGGSQLPNAGTTLHLSRMRSFSLWYCHFRNLLNEYA